MRILSEHGGGAGRVEIDYLDDHRVRVTEADGGTRSYDLTTVDGRQLATDIDGAACNCTQAVHYEYNNRGLVTRQTDRGGNVTTYQYNAAGLQTQRTEAAGTAAARTIATEWDTERRLPLAITTAGRRTAYTYDALGRVRTRTITDTATGRSRSTTYTYAPETGGIPGRLAAIDGPRTDVSDITRFAYDTDGNRVQVTNALGHITEITDHDAYGRPTALVDPNGRTTTLAYDAAGRLVAIDAGGRVTRLVYDAAGHLSRITRPTGVALEYTYDAAHRLTAIEDEQGNRIEYTLDAQGQRTAIHVSDQSGAVARQHQRVFDALGRLLRSIGAQGQTTRYAYDANGNRTQTTDPAGATTRRAFDALDRLIRQTDALGGITGFSYDAHDRLTAVTDPNGNTTRYRYNAFGDRTRIDSPDTGVTRYQYDAAGNVIAKTDARGNTTTYTYDALNRRISTTFADGTKIIYKWDTAPNGIGRLARIEGPAGTTVWTYNRHGDVVARRRTVDDLTLSTTHAYDAAGHRTATVYPSGLRITYSYAADDLSALAVDGTPVLSAIDYQPFGPVSGWTWGDGDIHTKTYDRDGRLIAHTLPAGQRSLSYSLDGQIAGITGPHLARSYGYDALDRLTNADGTDLTRNYSYDANGNRRTRSADGATTNYTLESGSNRLLAASGAQTADYSYDPAGHLTGDGTHTYSYNARGRLAQVDGGDTAVYRYNALGQRVYQFARLPLPDYAALATAAAAKADQLAEDARDLRSQAQDAARTAATARHEAADARHDLRRAQAQAHRAERTATRHGRQAARWQQSSDRFADQAQAYRQRIDDSGGGWQRFLNRFYGALADLNQDLADRFQDWAAEERARAEAATEEAATARAEAQAAQQRLAIAEQTVHEAQAEAQSLRTQATHTRQQAHAARAQAAEYRHLAKNPPPRPTRECRFVYNDQGQLIGVYDADGRPLREILYLGRLPIAVVAGDALYYVHTDHLGTPRAVSQPNGPVLWRWHSGPFGTTAPNEDPDGDGQTFTLNLRFPGQYFDQATGRHYNYFRYYDPATGRYISSDPIGLPGSMNTYSYVEGDPVGLFDPRGLVKVEAKAGGGLFTGWWGGTAETGFGFDTSGNVCIVTTTCDNEFTIGPGFASLGGSLSVSKGEFCPDGIDTSRVKMVDLGLGGVGGAAVGVDKNGEPTGAGKAFGGVGAGLGVGELTCTTRSFCWNPFD